MVRPLSTTLVSTLVIGGFLCGCAHRVSAPVPQIGAANAGWQSVSLPSQVTNVVAVGHTFWVCGADEMIAESADGGKSWQIKHRTENGSVLLTVGFASEKTGFAAGTGGSLLVTNDGGQTWARLQGNKEVIYNASFADERNGLIQTPSAVEFTHDGGATWQEVSVLRSEERLKKYAYVFSLAALDANRMAILVKEGSASYYDQRIVVTGDGGHYWTVKDIEHTVIAPLLARNGEYWALGIEVIDRSDHGGHAVSLVMHSNDGENWTRQPRPAREIENCLSTGCLLWNGAGVNPFGVQPSYWTYPPEKPTTAKWAVTSNSICIVAGTLACAAVTPSSNVPAYSDNTPIPAVTTPPPLGSRNLAIHGCISRPYEQMIVDQDYAGRAVVVLDISIAGNGAVSKVSVVQAPTPYIGSRCADAAKTWILESHRQDGVAVPDHAIVTLNVNVIKGR